MKKWRPYIFYWITYTVLESYFEFVWIQNSFAESSFLEILRMVILTELSFNIARIPTAILLSRILEKTRGHKGFQALKFLFTLSMGVILYRLLGVYIVLVGLYSMSLDEIIFFGIGSVNSAAINVILCSVIYISFVQYRKVKKAKKKEELLKKQNLETELKFLKAQLNPHFLFNTLNNLYGLVRSKDSRAPEIILHLSDLLRFMLYEANVRSIPLSNELDILEKYLALEKIRYCDRLTISLKRSVENTSYLVAPLLIIHLVENAFKHGISESTQKAFVEIDIEQKGQICSICIVNSKTQVTENDREKIGLNNLKRQLDLLYDSYQFDIYDENETFKLEIVFPNSLL